LRGTTQVRDGLVLGDVILAVNGKAVKDNDSLRDELERHDVGESVALTLTRDTSTIEVRVALEAMN
jgi:S1-C subfamily serine protease